MATKGVTEQPLVSSRYVSAGALLLGASVMFYFMVLRHVVKRAQDGIKMSSNWSEAFKTYIHNYFVLEALFRSCYFSAWLVAITAPSVASEAALVMVNVAGGIDRVIFQTNKISTKAKFVVSGILFFFALTVIPPKNQRAEK